MNRWLIPLLALMVVACSTPRKACRKAERHMARAAWLCPSALQVDTATVLVPGDTATAPPMAYEPIDVDSLEAACAELARTLMAEREKYEGLLAGNAPEKPLPVNTEAVQRAASGVRRVACRWEPWEYDHALFHLRALGGDTPGILVEVKEQKVKSPCPPALSLKPVIIEGVAEWYRTAFYIMIIFLLALFAARRLFAQTTPR